MPDLLSLQNAPQQALMSGDRVRQAERHADIAVRWTLTTPHARRPEALLRRGLVEPWYVDADVQPTILAWMGATAGKRRLPLMTLDSCSSWVFLAMNSSGFGLPCLVPF